jgi:hypothetical protein
MVTETIPGHNVPLYCEARGGRSTDTAYHGGRLWALLGEVNPYFPKIGRSVCTAAIQYSSEEREDAKSAGLSTRAFAYRY